MRLLGCAGWCRGEAVAPYATSFIHRRIERALVEYGVPVKELHLVSDKSQLRHAMPLRCDLREHSFGHAEREPRALPELPVTAPYILRGENA